MNPLIIAIAAGGGVYFLAKGAKASTPVPTVPADSGAGDTAPPASTSPPVLSSPTDVLGASSNVETCQGGCGGKAPPPGPGRGTRTAPPPPPKPRPTSDHRGEVVCIRAPCHVNPSEAGKAGGESPIETSHRVRNLGPAPVRW